MNMKYLLSLFLSATALAAPTVTSVEPRVDVAEVEARDLESRQAVTRIRFDSITASGSGCPSGSYTVNIPSARDVGTISFNNYNVVLGSTTSRDCTITVQLTYPSGCTSGNWQHTHHGFAQVDSGATGRVATSYSMTTGNNHTPADSVFSGGVWAPGNNWSKIDISSAKVINRSPNSASLSLTARTRLTISRNNNSAQGSVAAETVTFRVLNQQVNSNWQTCQ